jgi:GNAT superfamily N-acetyltransferase
MITIRPARSTDAHAIARIHTGARRDAMPYLPEVHSDEETLAWVREVVLPGQDVQAAVVDALVVGYIAIEGSTIDALYVSPSHQGRGIGSVLLHHAMDGSIGLLDLWTFQRNLGARRFYEARGFLPVEFTDGAGNEEHEPDVRYEWRRTGRPVIAS